MEEVDAVVRRKPEGWAPGPAYQAYGPGCCTHACQERLQRFTQAIAWPQSYIFVPQLNEEVVKAAMAIVPLEVRSYENDTKESLIARIAKSGFQ